MLRSPVSLCLALLVGLTAACGSDPAESAGSDDAGNIGDDTSADGGTGGTDGTTDLDGSEPAPDTPGDGGPAPDADPVDDTTPEDDVAIDAGPAPDTTPGPDTVTPEDTTPEPDTTVPDGPVDPYENGTFRFSTIDVRVPLGGGGDVAAKVYLPVSSAGGPYPAVLFGHGFQLQGGFYSGYAERMASHGIIVVVPTWGDSLFSARTHRQLAADVEAMVGWMITENDAGGQFDGDLDVNAIGQAGHSRGGKAAIYGTIEDDRVAAVFALDPVDSGPPFGGNATDYPSITPERMAELTVPFGIVGAGLGSDGGTFGQACAPASDNYQEYFNAAGVGTVMYVVPDAGHNQFLFSCSGLGCGLCVDGDDGEFMRDLSNAMMVSFFKVHLDDDTRYAEFMTETALEEDVRAGRLQIRSR